MVLALVVSSASGLLAAVMINGWMTTQFMRMKAQVQHSAQQPIEEKKPDLVKIVIAKEDVSAGTQLTRDKLSEVDWPVDNVPEGSFNSIDDLIGKEDNRVSLVAIYTNEPIIQERVSGPGQRKGLATMLDRGKRAVAIRVNEAVSVGGLIQPGDLVDIFVTNEKDDQAYTDLLLQNVRVLAVDQTTDPLHPSPIIGRTVTVEAGLADAQRITLASTVGSLSLALRESGNVAAAEDLERLTVADLPGDSGDKQTVGSFIPTMGVAPGPETVAPESGKGKGNTAKISVIRATSPTEYTVKRRN
jgi:pilus assembly protein CpaB